MDLAAGEDPLDVDEETRLALGGYRAAMTYVLQAAEDPDFQYNAQLFKSMHFMMTNYALKNRPGRWRAGSVYVRNEDTGEVVHEGADLDEVPALMKELAAGLNEPSAEPDLIRAAMAYFAEGPEEITEATATRDLQKLVQADLLAASGERRGRHYVARSSLVAIRQAVVRARVPRDDTDPFAA